VRVIDSQKLPNFVQCHQCPALAQFICLGQQYMNRFFCLPEPVQHLQIELCQRMAYIHDEYHTVQRLPGLQIGTQQMSPMLSNSQRYLCVTVSWQIDHEAFLAQLKKIDMLCPARRFTDEGKPFSSHQCIDCARFSGIGTSGKSNFNSGRLRQILQTVDCRIKFSMSEKRVCHDASS